MTKRIKLDIYEVKELLGQGLKRYEVARRLGVSYSTLHRFLQKSDLSKVPSLNRRVIQGKPKPFLQRNNSITKQTIGVSDENLDEKTYTKDELSAMLLEAEMEMSDM